MMGLPTPWRRRKAGLPPAVRARLSTLEAGRVLAWGRDAYTGAAVVATAAFVAVVADDGSVRLARPWLDVLAGSWEPGTETISVTWVGEGRGAQWTFGRGGAAFAEAFYDRVAASVLVDAPLVAQGRELGRAAIRRDLATGDLHRQVVRARGVRADDPLFASVSAAVLDDLAERVGLPPAGGGPQ